MHKKLLFFLFASLISVHYSIAQFNTDSLHQDWKPRVKGSGPVKGVEFLFHSNSDYNLSSDSELYGSGKGKIDNNRIITTKLRFPLLLKPKMKLAGSIEYSDEEIHFEDAGTLEYPLYQSLHDKNLKSIGGSLYFMAQLKGNMYFQMRFNGKLKGDYWREHIGEVSKYTFLKMEFSPVIGWKVSPYKSYGFGLAFSYTFGKPLIFPTFAYNHTFSDKWGVEAFLPAKIKLRYQPSELCFIYAKTRLRGGSYSIHFDNPDLNDFKTLELRRADINFSFEIEKGITNWLWFSVESGYRSNINFDVTNDNNKYSLSGIKLSSNKNIIQSSVSGGMFFNFGLFIVPSKSLLKKIGIK